MRLTHIKLAGFKSFTDPTTIHIPGKLVAVIGPNGCGKSNVIDAVRWVLGEASAKQLRGESMQDVIFNGAATRRPAPRASVELIFDNSSGTLSGEWGRYAEVSIKRQLTRQGESGYFINGQAVRRRDITDLFLGTGVGTRGYAVIEQGMISRIIEARPEELRAYIEEAAGVSKYKERRRETENRLKDARLHLQRLADLQTELARQVEKLERQASTAERYQTLQEELTHLSDLADYLAWQTALQQADLASEQHATAQAEQETQTEQAQLLDESVQNLRLKEQEQQEELHRLNREYALLREQRARLEEQIRARQNQQQRAQKEQLLAQTKLAELSQKLNQSQEESELLAHRIEEEEMLLSEWMVQLDENETTLPALEQAQQNAQHHLQHCRNEQARFKSELALKQQQSSQSEREITQNQERIQLLLTEQKHLNLPENNILEEAQERANALQEQYAYTEESLLQAEELTQQLKADFQAASTQLKNIETQLLASQTQANALQQLLKDNEKDDFWHNTPQQNAPVLWQHIRVNEPWQHALSILLAEKLYARTLPENFYPEKLPENGSAAWCHENSSVLSLEQASNALIQQVQCEKSFNALLQHTLAGVLCAPDLDYALQHRHNLQHNQSWITPEGHQVDAFSVVLFGSNSQNQLIRYQQRLEALQKEQEILQPQYETAQQQSQAIQEQLNAQENRCRQLNTRHREQAHQLQKAQSHAAELLARTNQAQLRAEHINIELKQLENNTAAAQIKKQSLAQDIIDLQRAITEWEEAIHTSESQLKENTQEFKQAQAQMFEIKRRTGLAELALHKSRQELSNKREQSNALSMQMQDWQERQCELALTFEEDESIQEQTAQFEALSEHSELLQQQSNQCQIELNHIQEQGRTAYTQLQNLSALLPQLAAAVQTALLAQQDALLKAKQHHDALTEREADMEKLSQVASHSNSKDTIANIRQLQTSINSLGPVNLAALEELEEARERDEYYLRQSQDIQQSIDLLEEAIAQIDNETKTRFKTTFDAVNEKVQHFFPVLFGGGQAGLQMVGDDLLSAGVAINARPPGKKNTTIHLLSGGEKALTAMSLVFALFHLNPAPFCLLDEVDAPLDDANTARFCNLVKEMSAQTQFLYISHNRLTMEMAEQLVGVTMQEKGVSRIVEVDIQQALKMAENT